ncbi:MAG: EF-P 5-aminopentanol modification-associated protein YfmH [Bacillota bacterium]
MQEIYNDIIKEKLYKKVLDNGLTVMMMPRKGFNKNYGIFAANYGSTDNKFINPQTEEQVTVPDGIAHFLEHKLFEGKKGNTFSKFASLGASTNAFTNYNTTAYLFNSTSNFIESTTTLLDFVQEPYFTDKNVDKEKGIIAQEIRMYEDSPDYQAYVKLLDALYIYHPVKIDIAGTIESISKITKEDLYLCYNTFYNPGNMVLFLTGDFNINNILEKIEENQEKKDMMLYKKIDRIFPDEPTQVNQEMVISKMDVSEPLFRLGIKEQAIPENDRELVKQELTTDMLLDLLIGKSTKLYQDLYDQGLIDDNFSSYSVLEKNYGYALLGGKSKDPEKLYELLIDGFKKRIANISREEFTRIIHKNLGEYIEAFNSFESVASEFISYHFKDISFFDVMDIMREIDFENLLDRYNLLFSDNNISRSIIIKK